MKEVRKKEECTDKWKTIKKEEKNREKEGLYEGQIKKRKDEREEGRNKEECTDKWKTRKKGARNGCLIQRVC